MIRGQTPRRLSDHYRLECDFGMSILAIYNEGDAVFLCENHVSAIAPKDSCFAGVRPVEASARSVLEEIAAERDQERAAEIVAEAANANPVIEAAPAPSAPAQPVVENCTNLMECETEAERAPRSAQIESPLPAADCDSADLKCPARAAEPPPVAPSSAAHARPPAQAAAASPVTPRSVAAAAGKTPRDLAYGNPAKALVDETIWNMAPGDLAAYRSALEQGKSPLEAAQAAGGQLAMVHRKIAEYTAKLEPILSASQATISVGSAIDKPLEQAILEIIGNDAMAEPEKDDAVERLGAFQKQIKSGVEAVISPPQAHRIAREISDRANGGAHFGEVEQVKQAYRAVHSRLRDALRALVPEARELEERLANLHAAKSDLENPRGAKPSHSAAV
ncbi:MAG: hypothetical protein KGL02_05625 [Acidobacteriota bacterium]|nr:hypothetical protein [Acidobacteriota bacterium]MDE3169049.1 hypothetical protein [Acidobacteriota bacterium]